MSSKKIDGRLLLLVDGGSATPSATDSFSPSDECWSAPSTRPPSRAPSMQSPTTTRPRAPSSTHSDGHKFNLRDLIASAPKLTRNRSNSSRKSDSDGPARSVAGDSNVSLTQKYGVCQKVAIGKGATSVVRLAHKWDRTEEKLYAVKEFRKRRKNESEKEYIKKLTAEFCISSTLHHINIVETVDLVQDESQHWCEVMEFCPGGDLYAAIKKGGMSPSEVECCFKQILSGVHYLHSQGVAHRDIKPENLFFDTKGHLKIGDYGASTVYRLPWETTIHMSTGLCGSEPYIAPELFQGKPYDARLVDIWACAIVYYCLHFQEMPWRVAQQSDPLYASYSAACASAPFPGPTAVAAKGGDKDKGSEKDKEGTSPPPNHTTNGAPITSDPNAPKFRPPNPTCPPSSLHSSSTTTTSNSAPASSTSHLPTSHSSNTSHSSHAASHSVTNSTAANNFPYPPTISNLSPRPCRSLIRRMLEPDPRTRIQIEEVMTHPWMAGIEVCYLVEKPKHLHRACMAGQQGGGS